MKNILLILMFSLTALSSNAKKIYSITVNVYSLGTKEPIIGAKVSASIHRKILYNGVTDSTGKVIIENMTGKYVSIDITDPNTKYQKGYSSYFNNKRVSEEKFVYLRWIEQDEENEFNAINEKYPNNDSIYSIHEISKQSSSSNVDSINYVPPGFPGGPGELQRFISATVRYPEDCIKKDIQGRVFLSFIIQEDGTVTNVRVDRGVNKSLDKESKRVMYYMPKWKPATLNGKAIKSKAGAPVVYTLQ
jgi:TonB family protein